MRTDAKGQDQRAQNGSNVVRRLAVPRGVLELRCLAHSQKTVARRLTSGHDSLVAVKDNQPQLFNALKAQFEHTLPQTVAQADAWTHKCTVKEDSTPVGDGNAGVHVAISRTLALKLLRQHGFDTMTHAIRQVAHAMPRLFSFFQ